VLCFMTCVICRCLFLLLDFERFANVICSRGLFSFLQGWLKGLLGFCFQGFPFYSETAKPPKMENMFFEPVLRGARGRG
jgi:hypothetical protein